jgi:hypothetical protein
VRGMSAKRFGTRACSTRALVTPAAGLGRKVSGPQHIDTPSSKPLVTVPRKQGSNEEHQ